MAVRDEAYEREDIKGVSLPRRAFLKLSLTASGLLMSWGIFRFLSYQQQSENPVRLTLQEPIAYPPDSITPVPQLKAWILRDEAGLYALSAICTHLGCTVNWIAAENQFVCPCHAATFDFYGNHASPPVPRPLDTFPVRIEDTTVLVDTSQPRRRERFAPEQLVYATEMQAATEPSGGPGEDSEGPEG